MQFKREKNTLLEDRNERRRRGERATPLPGNHVRPMAVESPHFARVANIISHRRHFTKFPFATQRGMARNMKVAKSKKQAAMIVRFMQRNPLLVKALPAGVKSMRPARKAALWKELGDRLNAEARKTGQGAQKAVGSWRKTWLDMKARSKKKRMYVTSLEQLDPLERDVIDLLDRDVCEPSRVELTIPGNQETIACSVVLHNGIAEANSSSTTTPIPRTSIFNGPSTSQSATKSRPIHTKPKRKYTRRAINGNLPRRSNAPRLAAARSNQSANQEQSPEPRPDSESSTNTNRPRGVSGDRVSMTEGHSTELPRAHQTESKSIQAVADAIVAHNAIQRQRNKLLKHKNSLDEQMLELKKRKVTAIELAVEKFLSM